MAYINLMRKSINCFITAHVTAGTSVNGIPSISKSLFKLQLRPKKSTGGKRGT
jgi:hypothetical protein